MQYHIPNPNVQQTFGNISYFGCANGQVARLDWSTGDIKYGNAHKSDCPVGCIAFDDQYVYSGGWDKRIFRYNRDTMVLDTDSMFFDGDSEVAHTDFLKSLSISADKCYLFSGSADGIVAKWDLKDNKMVASIKLCERFINSIVLLGDSHILCGGSSRQLYVLDNDLKLQKTHQIKDCQNISKIIVKGQMIFILSKDIHVLQNFQPKFLFVMPQSPVELYFNPTLPNQFIAACEDEIRIVQFDQAKNLDYYDILAQNGAKMTAEDCKLMFKQKQKEEYQLIPAGFSKSPCGFECQKQLVKTLGKPEEQKQKECYMYIYGAHDEIVRRIFAFPADREWFGLQQKQDDAEMGEMGEDELEAEMLEEIKYKRLQAMLAGSDTWHKDKF